MKIIIAGGSGFLGQRLTSFFTSQKHEVIILSRKPSHLEGSVKHLQWSPTPEQTLEHLEDADAFINLAGTSLNEGRWTDTQKQKIVQSRVKTTKEVLKIIDQLHTKPKVYINASAVGIYPISEKAVYDESSTIFANDFLGDTVQKWEHLAKKAEDFGVRSVQTRFGVILGKNGGALPMMALPYKFYAGGNLGSGMQWVSWVHIDDVVRAIDFAIQDCTIKGAVNVTSPNPIRMKQLGQTIGQVLHKPHWFPTPSPLLRVALGEKSIMVLEGQRVLPTKLLEHGFEFNYPKIKDALVNLF